MAQALRALAHDLWAYVGLSLLLTALIGNISSQPGIFGLAMSFSINLVISISIGACFELGYRSVLPSLGISQDLGAPILRQLPIHLLVYVCATGVGVEIGLRLVNLIFSGAGSTHTRMGILRVAIPISAAMALVGTALKRHRRRAEAAEQETAKSQLQALQARLNPHFLFNSLNTIAGLIEEDPKRAEHAVEQLAQMFRYSLQGAQQMWVTLAQEIEAVDRYLEFERLRYGDRLKVQVMIPSVLRTQRMPPLILQPLVENAVNHGIGKRQGGQIIIEATEDASGRLSVAIEDDGPGMGGSEHQGTQTATEDIQRRLNLLYDSRAALNTSKSRLGGHRVELVLPIPEPRE